MRRKPPYPLFVPPILLCAMLVFVLILAGCSDDGDPETTAPATLPGEGSGLIPDDSDPGNELTPVIPPCPGAVPAAAVEEGTRQTVRGNVVNTRVVEDELGEVTLLEMGEEGGDVPFAIAIPDRARAEFAEPPADLYEDTEVCVNGVVQEFQGTPVIFVASDNEIITTGE